VDSYIAGSAGAASSIDSHQKLVDVVAATVVAVFVVAVVDEEIVAVGSPSSIQHFQAAALTSLAADSKTTPIDATAARFPVPAAMNYPPFLRFFLHCSYILCGMTTWSKMSQLNLQNVLP